MPHRLLALFLVLLLSALPVVAAPETVTGTVTYRERIALPPGASLRVTLVRLDTGAPVLGVNATLDHPGQPPFTFTLNLRTSLAEAPHGVVAEIMAGGQVLFRSAATLLGEQGAPIAILVQPARGAPLLPERLDLPAPDPRLVGRTWNVTSIGGRPVLPGTVPTLVLAADLRANGFAGCNEYFAEARLEEGMLHFGPPAATRKSCAGAMADQELALFAALAATAGYIVDGPRLRLLDAAGVPLLGLIASQEP